MTPSFAQFRALARQQEKKPKKKCLQVKISKEPPVIHKFHRDILEYTSECIYDPLVCHDNESDHPDLVFDGKKRLAPWRPPSSPESPNKLSFKRLAVWTPKPKVLAMS